MSNNLKYTRRVKVSDGKPRSDGYNVWVRHAIIGVVRSDNGGAWTAFYDDRAVSGTWRTREEAGQRLITEHENRWGPLGDDGGYLSAVAKRNHDAAEPPKHSTALTDQRRYTGGSGPTPIAVVEGTDLIKLANALRRAQTMHPKVRLTVSADGIKWDAGHGWTPSIGRLADETGH